MSHDIPDKIPLWSMATPAVAAVLSGLVLTHAVPESAVVFILCAVALGACVFAAVHHAEMLALKVGEPLGSIILAAAVTIIEVGLIVSIMLSGRRAARWSLGTRCFPRS